MAERKPGAGPLKGKTPTGKPNRPMPPGGRREKSERSAEKYSRKDSGPK